MTDRQIDSKRLQPIKPGEKHPTRSRASAVKNNLALIIMPARVSQRLAKRGMGYWSKVLSFVQDKTIKRLGSSDQ